MQFKKIPAYFASIGLIFLLAYCAGQIPPPGGPVDSNPPAIIRTSPDTNAVRVQAGSVELEFSEYVDRRSVEESIFISPYPGVLEFDWGSTDVTVTFSEPLKKNRTYVVNIGTDVVDVRARNRMASGYTLAFSTGDSIDQGVISGRVYDETPEGIMIFAYILDGMNADTLDPGNTPPDYIMQTGHQGVFTLSNIALAKYRLFAVRDEYRDLIYNKQIDEFGVTPDDIVLSTDSKRVENVMFRLSREDTASPFLTSVQALDRNRLLVKFSEPLDTVSFSGGSFVLEDTLMPGLTDISVISLHRPSFASAVVILPAGLDSSTTYRLTVRNVFDSTGNGIDSLNNSYVFHGTGEQDTTGPALWLAGVKDSVRDFPLTQPIVLSFSEPVERGPLQSSIMLADSSRNQVSFELRWLNATDVTLIPRRELATRSWYRLSVVMDSVRDLIGNGYRDSTLVVRFETMDVRSTGVVEGTVFDERKGGGEIYLTASRMDHVAAEKKTIRLPGPGRFTIDRIPEGGWTLDAFRDADSSGAYTYGLPYPFKPSERFVVGSDTLRVRARWNVEGVLLKLK